MYYRKQKNILKNNKNNSFRINAVDFKNNFYPYSIIKHPNLNPGEHGCMSSHIKAYIYFLNNSSDEFCFISEDDVSNPYSIYWKQLHYDLLKNSKYDLLQLQTTENYYSNINLQPICLNKNCSGTTFYRISRNIVFL